MNAPRISADIEQIRDFGVTSNGVFMWSSANSFRGRISSGMLASICYGELNSGVIPKRRSSDQWVAVLKKTGDTYLGLTLDDGWMAGHQNSLSGAA